MGRYSVDDIAEMAVLTRQDGYTDRHAHGGTTQGQRDGAWRVSCGEADCQGERLQFALLTIDEWKYVVIGLHIFPLDFSECSE